MGDQEFPFYPATLEFLIVSLKTQAELHLGLLHMGDEQERPEPDFRIARHSIDLLGMLQEKTRGNCTVEEQRLLDNSITELRFRFVQAMERHEKQAGEAASESKPADAKESGTEGQAGG